MHINKKKKIIIIGCSNMGAKIAGHLCITGNAVTIVDINKDAFKKLSHVFSGFQFEGDATDMEILNMAGIKTADTVLIATDDDNTNSMIAQMCKTIIGVKEVVVRMDDNDADFILESQGIAIIHPSELSLSAFLDITNMESDEK